jgi:hypothetical protein
MKLSTKAFAATAGLLWGGAVFLTGLAGLLFPGYASLFLQVAASFYPGYAADGSFPDLMVGTLWAFIDGAVSGALFCWLYNWFADKITAR